MKWRFKTQGAISYPATVGPNGTVYLGGGDAHAGPDPYFYVLNGTTGALITKYDTGKTRVGTPVIGPNGQIYVPAQPDLYTFAVAGAFEWQLPTAASGGGCAPPPAPCAPGGSGPGAGPGPGSPSTSTFEQGIIPPAVGPDGTLYNGTDTGKVFALDPSTKTVKWTYQTGPDPTNPSLFGNASFPLVDSKGTVYIGSDDYNMYAIDKNGTVVWKYRTGGHITEASPAFGASGTLYFTSSDGYLYAVG